MKLHTARLGCFQLRGGRQASIFQVNPDGSGTGLLVPVSPQGEPEMGHTWKANGEYSISFAGVPHMLDLIQLTSQEPKTFEDYSAA